ncbi:MAG: hypothetical protein K6A14_07715 [Erysipelotrichaceae bacterium]|nr:hypothetical protein [Erysipelotrichaceae bacterium]
MERILLNGALELTSPDGFRRLNEEEIKKFNFANEMPGCVLQNEERHVIISLAWRKVNALLSKLFSVKELAGRMADYIADADKDYGHKRGDSFAGTVAGEKAAGFNYSYTVEEVGMDARVIITRHRGHFYYMYFYFRSANREESLKLIEQIVSSMQWKEK